MRDYIKEQQDWIRSGKIGCVFASMLVKQAEKIGWHFQVDPSVLYIPRSAFLMSIIFPNGNAESVKEWALKNGMHIEKIDDMHEGLRIQFGVTMRVGDHIAQVSPEPCVSWVQYFGPDSHVKTRQSPHAMLSFCVKLPKKYYAKVGFNGILHLAHASIEHISDKLTDKIWDRSFAHTKEILGHSPTVSEAAKTTFKK